MNSGTVPLLVPGLAAIGLLFVLTTGVALSAAAQGVTQPPPEGMVLIPAGSFSMGDSFAEGHTDESPAHTVTVSAFYMDIYVVTKARWDDVATWAKAHRYDIRTWDAGGRGPDHPAYDVSWYEAVKWANAKSEKEELVPAYYTSEEKNAQAVYRTGEIDLESSWVDWDAGYRLPTEAEWERAARGGADGHRFPWSDVETISHARANYDNRGHEIYETSATQGFHPDYDFSRQPYTSPVGSFAPNGYGLYDVAGNVWEWTWDWYLIAYYSQSPETDPRGPDTWSGRARRVLRGGSWGFNAEYLRVAERIAWWPTGSDIDLGFRLAMTAPKG